MLPLTLDRLPRRLLAQLDLETVFKASRCVVAAERLQLFRRLDGRELTAAEIGRRVGLHARHRDSFLNLLAALGLLSKRGKRYRVSALGRKYFVRERGIHWTRLWSQYCADDYAAFSVLEKSLTTGRDYREILGIRRESDYELLRHDQRWADDFTHIMHDTKRQSSKDLALNLDLASYTALLDVGGGSGVMSMALVRKYPHLRACVLDFPPVCRAARKIIRAEGFSRRVKTLAGDMTQQIPKGYDVILFWDVGDIPDRAVELAFGALPAGGMVVIGGGYFSAKAGRSVNRVARRLTLVGPKLDTWRETVGKLKAAGFVKIKRRRIRDDTWIISGNVPGRAGFGVPPRRASD